MQLELTVSASGALWNALSLTKVSGYTDLKRHAKLKQALRKGATKSIELPAPPADLDPASKTAFEEKRREELKKDPFEFSDGKIELTPGTKKYMEKVLEERSKEGVPGNIAHGYGELLMAIDGLDGEAEDIDAEEVAEKK